MPLNSMQNSYGDSVLLYMVHQVVGSGDLSTDTLRRDRCFVHVQIDVYSAHHIIIGKRFLNMGCSFRVIRFSILKDIVFIFSDFEFNQILIY